MMTADEAKNHLLNLAGYMRGTTKKIETPNIVELRVEGYEREGFGVSIPLDSRKLIKNEHRAAYDRYLSENQLIPIEPGSSIYVKAEN